MFSVRFKSLLHIGHMVAPILRTRYRDCIRHILHRSVVMLGKISILLICLKAAETKVNDSGKVVSLAFKIKRCDIHLICFLAIGVASVCEYFIPNFKWYLIKSGHSDKDRGRFPNLHEFLPFGPSLKHCSFYRSCV